MCGITGILDFSRTISGDALASTCGSMADALRHRGPDDRGVWTDPSAGVALGHRRLSILDLSPLGHQPMTSGSGRFVVTYNGELYNFADLRGKLGGHALRGRSDTEVMLAAFDEWGVEASLPRFNGMFALGVWDTRERVLWLARDRFGEKPLYYGRIGRALVFGSELKAICRFPGFAADVDRGALTQMLRFGYVPAPSCIFHGMRKLPAATCLRIAREADVGGAPAAYWSLEDVAREGLAHPYGGTDADAAEELDRLLQAAVQLRMMADVPLGAFLSGGIDSSTVVAMMQASSGRKVRTFTIGFTEAAYNEAESAREVAAHLGTDHTELYVQPPDAQAVIPLLPALYDEPFADSSQIPTFIVARLARAHVTVALSGDGGDELFGGYNRYFWGESVWRALRSIPRPVRASLARVLRRPEATRVDAGIAWLQRYAPSHLRVRAPGALVAKVTELLSVQSSDELFFGLLSAWKDPSSVTGVAEPAHRLLQGSPVTLGDFAAEMMCADARTYLPDDILVKVDRAAMGVSLETRVPFLDPAIARFAWSLPKRLKMRRGVGKVLLRTVLAKHVPRSLFERPKMGFGVPIAAWLQGPLRDWAESLLAESRLRQEGFLDPRSVQQKWANLLAGGRNSEQPVWAVLMFQAWLAESRKASAAVTPSV